MADSQPHMIENTGSTARDFCMLERNILSHLKLALLLSLLSFSVLLRARLVPTDGVEYSHKLGLPMATIQIIASIAAIAAGCWEYRCGFRDLRDMKAFLVSPGWVVHFTIKFTEITILQTTSGNHEHCGRNCIYHLYYPARRKRAVTLYRYGDNITRVPWEYSRTFDK
jgi:hypothetical protein